MKKAIIQAHTMANEKLHADATIDDTLSGTTAISVLMRGRTMYVNNVGDSRAIMISVLEDGSALPQPLSSDQTPYRKDERERVQACGARVLTMDQIDGIAPIHDDFGDFGECDGIDESGDPPRIWHPEGDYPGTAFTRSIGDMIAEELGVIAEPEILVR
jgi:serine/threonine protein phosphatase PrpC